MSFIEPLIDRIPGTLSPLGVGRFNPLAERIFPDLPRTTKSFLNKYNKFAPVLRQVPPEVRNSLISYDAQRVARGGRPLTETETNAVLSTILTGEPFTPPAERGFNPFSNVVSDLTEIVKGIPRLPLVVADAVTSAAGGDFSKLASFIPGAYTAETLGKGGGGPAELARHPLMTLLDILPFGARAAGMTRVGRAATAEARLAGRRPRPLTAFATRRATPAGIVPRRLPAFARAVRDETRFGQMFDQVWGGRNRDMARVFSAGKAHVSAQLRGFVDEDVELVQAARASADLNKRYSQFDETKRADLYQRLQSADPDALRGLSDAELAYVGEVRGLNVKYATHALSRDDLAEVYNDVTKVPELYPYKIANKIKGQTFRTKRVEDFNFARKELIFDPTLSRSDYVTAAKQAIDAPGLPKGRRYPPEQQTSLTALSERDRRTRVRSAIFAMDAQGFDTERLLSLETKAHNTGDWSELRTALDDPPTPIVAYSPDEVVKILRRQRQDALAERLATAIETSNTPLITETLNRIESRATRLIPDMDDTAFSQSIRRFRKRIAFVEANLRPYTPKLLAREQARLQRVIADNPPARVRPAIRAKTEQRAIELFSPASLTPDQAAEVARLVMERRFAEIPGWDEIEATNAFGNIQRDVSKAWQDLIQLEGPGPTFVHKVSSRRADYFTPRVSEVPNTISQVKERTAAYAPGVQDAGVALTDQGMEYLERAASETAVALVVKKYGRKLGEVQGELGDRARRLKESSPSLSDADAMERTISARYTKFDPDEAGYTWGSPVLNAMRRETSYIPNSIARNLKLIHNPATPLHGLIDPVTKLFRVSVIGLSPRTHLYNILGGLTMVLGRTGPGSIKYLKDGLDWARNPQHADEAIRGMIGSQRQVFKELDKPTQTKLAVATRDFMFGTTVGRLWNGIQQSKVGRAGKFLVEKSYDANSLVDDMYRATAYMYGRDKALTKGMTREAAEAAGVEILQRTLADYASMTPIELSLVKSVIPFYTFMQHAARYVLTYPIDHPVRASVMAKVAQIELNEMNDLLPSRFLSSLFVGDRDEEGNQRAVNLAGVNPFGDVANTFTLAGFLGNTHPIIDGVMAAVGVERGEADLYPTLRANPETGRLDGVRRNPVTAMIESIVPQTQILTSIIGINADFNERVIRDPDGALRALYSAAGVPALYRTYNVPQEIYAYETARSESVTAARNKALREGDWTSALRYPSLRDYFAQIEQLGRQGELRHLVPPSDLRERLVTAGQRTVSGTVLAPNLAATSGPGI